jgi:hypothetical protein
MVGAPRCPGSLRRLGRVVAVVGGLDLQREQQRALGHAVPDRDLKLAHDTVDRRRHVHRRLVGLQRDQRILGAHGVAGRDVDLDHRDVVEVPDVRHGHLL